MLLASAGWSTRVEDHPRASKTVQVARTVPALACVLRSRRPGVQIHHARRQDSLRQRACEGREESGEDDAEHPGLRGARHYAASETRPGSAPICATGGELAP